MTHPNFTIIIPHKNTPGLLQKCLDSIPQSDDIQVIVVDDNSDESVVDFENFPGLCRKNTEIYFTKEGKGAGYARNVGLAHVRGSWVIFADADDFFHLCLLEALERYQNADADIIFLKADSRNLADGSAGHRADGYNSRVDVALATGNFQPVLLYSSPCNKIFNATLVKDIRFNECQCGNDVVFMAKSAFASARYLADPSVVYCITVSGTSITANRSLQNMEIRLQQDLEGLKYYKCRFTLTEADKYWYFITWNNVYERSFWTALKYVMPMFRAIGLYCFVKNYLKMLKRKSSRS